MHVWPCNPFNQPDNVIYHTLYLDRQDYVIPLMYVCINYITCITFLVHQSILIFRWDNILFHIIKMKSCIILLCLLAVVYSKQVEVSQNNGIQQQIKDQFLENVEDTKSVIADFFSNILERPSLKSLVSNIVGWITGVLIASIFAQIP